MPPRLPRSRATILVAVLLLSMALAAALAHEAWRAERSHRATADRTLRDYAAFAAWEFTVAAKSKMYSNILYVFSPVMHEEALGPHAPLEPPQVLLRPAVREKLCPETPPYAFRLDVATSELTFAGDVPSLETTAACSSCGAEGSRRVRARLGIPDDHRAHRQQAAQPRLPGQMAARRDQGRGVRRGVLRAGHGDGRLPDGDGEEQRAAARAHEGAAQRLALLGRRARLGGPAPLRVAPAVRRHLRRPARARRLRRDSARRSRSTRPSPTGW